MHWFHNSPRRGQYGLGRRCTNIAGWNAGSVLVAVFFFFISTSAVFAQADAGEAQDISSAPVLQEASVQEEAGASGIQVPQDSSAPSSPQAPVQPPQEVLLDEQVTLEDLGAREARILPDSPWHGMKRLWWGVQEAFTFDPVTDAALKLEHANQEFGEMKQLMDRDGIADVSASVITDVAGRFQARLEKVTSAKEQLRQAKDDRPEEVDAILNTIVGKQLNQQKVLDAVSKDIMERKKNTKAEAQEADAGAASAEVRQPTEDDRVGNALLAAMHKTKRHAAAQAAEVLADVDASSEAMSSRLNSVLSAQAGSPFRDIKHLEFLEELAERAPDSVQDAVALSKQKTKKQFEARIKELPAAVRAERFKTYVSHANADETKMFTLLDEIKKTGDVPVDVLRKLDEIKEVMAKRFEEKLTLIDDASVQDQFLAGLSDADTSADVLALEEIRHFVRGDSAVAVRIQQTNDAALQAFKDRFTDAASQDQAALFQKLSRDMQGKPSPKALKLLREMETEVRSDPQKRAFLDDMETAMRRQMEAQFRHEGDAYFERIASRDPADLAVYDSVDFAPAFKESAVKKQVEEFKRRMLGTVRPEEFDMIFDDFLQAPPEVIDRIKQVDPAFQQDFVAKQRAIEEGRIREDRERQVQFAALDYGEREFYHQFDRSEQQRHEDFWDTYNTVPWENFEERKALYEQFMGQNVEQQKERFAEQQKLFEERLKLDPFGCDEVCQKIQTLTLEQEQRHQLERLGDELQKERKRIERERTEFKQNNVLFGKCNVNDPTGGDCEAYCQSRPDERGCEFVRDIIEDCPQGQYWDFGARLCLTQDIFCAPGFYPQDGECVEDPYFRRPACGPDASWNEERGYCRPNENARENACELHYDAQGRVVPLPPFCYEIACPQGTRWDAGKKDCRRNEDTCGPGFYFDAVARRCVQDPRSTCADQEYWDAARGACVSVARTQCPVADVMPCSQGQYRETYQNENGCWVQGECRTEQIVCSKKPVACPAGQYRETFQRPDGCTEWSACKKQVVACPRPLAPEPCPAGARREFITDQNGCTLPGQCISDERVQKVLYTFSDGFVAYDEAQARAHCRAYGPGSGRGIAEVCKTKFSIVYETKPQCGNGVCESGETQSSCAADCVSKPAYTACIDYPDSASCTTKAGCSWFYKDGRGYCGDEAYRNDGTMTCPTGWTYNGTFNSCVRNGITCSNPTACSACPNNSNDTNRTTWCQMDNDGCPTGCQENTWDTGGCGSVNDKASCTAKTDCYWHDGSGTTGGSYCFYQTYVCDYDAVCETGESAPQCGDCSSTSSTPPSACNNNGVCEGTESYSSCAADCVFPGDENSCPGFAGSKYDSTNTRYCQLNDEEKCEFFYPDYLTNSNYTAAECPKPTVCGDGVCSTSETASSCPSDCYTCAAESWRCVNKTECESNGHLWCGSGCYAAGTLCETGTICGNGTCETGETSTNCSADCKQSTAQCGNGVCESGETSSSCAADCKTSSTACDSDGVCESGESSGSCPSDCSTYGGNGTMNCGTGWTYSSTFNSCVRDGVTCSNPTACSECPSGSGTSGSKWCQMDNDGCPTGCQENTWDTGGCGSYSSKSGCEAVSNCYWKESTGDWSSYCYYQTYVCDYDAVCESGESATQCGDCSSGSGSGSGNWSGGSSCNNNGTCETGETNQGCSSDCTFGVNNTCGNGTCEAGEDTGNCSPDCGGSSSYCGNGFCESGETASNCPSDHCGAVQGFKVYAGQSESGRGISPMLPVAAGVGGFMAILLFGLRLFL